MSTSIGFRAERSQYGITLAELISKYDLIATPQDETTIFETQAAAPEGGSVAASGASKAPFAKGELFNRLIVCAANFAVIEDEEIADLDELQLALIHFEPFQIFSRTISGAESLYSKKQRIWAKASQLTKGLGRLFHEAILIKPSYWQEVLLKDHPYGADIGDYLSAWEMNKKITYSFDDFMALKPPHLRPQACVHYLTNAEKKGMEIQFIEGKLYFRGAPLDTSTIETDKEEGYAIYVLSCDFQFYVGPYLVGKFHHSSFVSGGPVLGAGEIKTDKDGTLLSITSKSGHYKPTPVQFHTTLEFLEAHGVDLSKVSLIENGSSGSLKKYASVPEFRVSTPSPTKGLFIRSSSGSPAVVLASGGGGLSPSLSGHRSPAFFIDGAHSPTKQFSFKAGAGVGELFSVDEKTATTNKVTVTSGSAFTTLVKKEEGQ